MIDGENGIPFFTPFYVKVPKILLIHHIHLEVFKSQLKFPLSQIGQFLEAKLMPKVYKNIPIITVSQSSKKEINQINLGSSNLIKVINPGINSVALMKFTKTKYPTILYLGRIKPYKNIDLAILAFKQVIKKFPNAKCSTLPALTSKPVSLFWIESDNPFTLNATTGVP